MVTVKEQLEGYRQVIKDLSPEKFDAQLLIDIKKYIFSIGELKAAFQENLQRYEKINNSAECNKIRLEFNEHICNDNRLKHLNTEDKLPTNCIREIFQNICNVPKFSQCHSIKELLYSYNEDVNTANYLKKELWKWLIHSKIGNIDYKLCNRISDKMDNFFSLFDGNCLDFAVIGLDKCNSFKNKNITLMRVATYNVLMELECIVAGNTSTDIKEPKLTLSGIVKKENIKFSEEVYDFLRAGFEPVEREPGVSYSGPPVLLLPETKEEEQAKSLSNIKRGKPVFQYSKVKDRFTLNGITFDLKPFLKKYLISIYNNRLIFSQSTPNKLNELNHYTLTKLKTYKSLINSKSKKIIGCDIIDKSYKFCNVTIKGFDDLLSVN